MKTYVLMISEFFPSTHPRKGQDTGFSLAIKHYDKIHTIRGNYWFWEKRIKEVQAGRAYLSIRVWVGKPYGKGSKAVEVFRFDKTHGVGIQPVYQRLDLFFLEPGWEKQLSNAELAKNDGLSMEDFDAWFPPVIVAKKMAIIHFTPFRYLSE